MKQIQIFLVILTLTLSMSAKEYHVARTGADNNKGTSASPFLTIQAAADLAQPGDVIIVHGGIYREWVNPPRGGVSDSERIVYQAAPGEKVEIKGSEVIDSWEKFMGTVWKVSIPNSFFGDYNPYKDEISGDWFNGLGRIHHTGEVYLNGKSFWEKAIIEEVLYPVEAKDAFDPEGSLYTWYCETDKDYTYIYANFHDVNPNEELVEINVRKSCFYPEENGIDYITVSGFHLEQAATQWAPPTAEQPGLIGTNWSKKWIIENNVIRNSKCSGITLGKHGDEFDNTSANSAEGYVETIKRALVRGWSKETIGSHIVRNNSISECGQTGICGSMGGVFSTIENNDIFNIWTKRQWTGAEMGGIKIHASIDMKVLNNRLANCGRGLWLDWMAQGTIVKGNLLYSNTTDDLFVEVDHGPFLIANNILLSDISIRDWSEGGAFVHNLVAGNIQQRPSGRATPYHLEHSTIVKGIVNIKGGDNRYYNNIFVGGVEETESEFSGLASFNETELPVFIDANVYLNGAKVYDDENENLVLDVDPEISIEETNKGVFLSMDFDKKILKMKNRLVDTEMLGKALIPELGYVYPDGSRISITKDFSGKERNKSNPTPGPFEDPGSGKVRIKVWEF